MEALASLIARLVPVTPRPHLENIRIFEAETERTHQIGITVFRNTERLETYFCPIFSV